MILAQLRKGFTLVELMVVMAIIGMLAAAFYPSLTGYLARGRDATRVTEIKQINTAVVLSQVANRTYKPTLLSGIGKGWINTTITGEAITIVKALETKGYLKNGIQDIPVAEMYSSPVVQNTTPCVTSTGSQNLYMFYFDDATGKYSVSGYMENQLKPNIDNIVLSYNSGTTCGVYGRNYAVGIN